MSKIGKLPITLEPGTTVTLDGKQVSVSGLKGQLGMTIPSGMKVLLEDNIVRVVMENEDDFTQKAMYGLTRALLNNLVKGVTVGFEKKLELVGVGYRAQMQGETLVLSLGFSHPVKFTPREGVKIAVVENNIIVSGIKIEDVGEAAAKIRDFKKPEPYKGKGIKYSTERIRRKAGKAAKAVGGK